MMKRCCRCKTEKNSEAFGLLRSSKDGLSKRCKECSRFCIAETKKKRGVKKCDPEKARARTARFYAAHPEYAKTMYWRHRDKSLAHSKAWRLKNLDKARANSARGYALNREKRIEQTLAWQRAHPDIVNRKNAEFRRAHPEKMKEYTANYDARNPGRRSELRKAWNAAHPWVKAASVALRRAQKKQATPKWADLAAIRAIYKEAKIRSQQTGLKWEVDHIYPLQSDVMCGLHVAENLRVILASENRAKGNKVVEYG